MVRVACTHMAMGWVGGVLYSRVAWTRSYFRGSKGRLVYVGQGPVAEPPKKLGPRAPIGVSTDLR